MTFRHVKKLGGSFPFISREESSAGIIRTLTNLPKGFLLVNQGFDEETAVSEAKRCLGTIHCESCGVCQLFCPDSCITYGNSGHAVIDYNYCKGCSICTSVCPKGAIKMMLEES